MKQDGEVFFPDLSTIPKHKFEEISDTINGIAFAIDSTIGNPNDSNKEGNTNISIFI